MSIRVEKSIASKVHVTNVEKFILSPHTRSNVCKLTLGCIIRHRPVSTPIQHCTVLATLSGGGVITNLEECLVTEVRPTVSDARLEDVVQTHEDGVH